MSDEHLTNRDLAEMFEKHAHEDQDFQNEQRRANGETATFKAETEGSLSELHKKIADIPNNEQTAQIVEDVIKRLLLKNGKYTFHFIVGSSVLIGSLVVIFGGLKTVLAWIGFSYMK
jgi:hypothetical protein